MIKLSILIPSTHTRYNTFLPKIQEQIFSQYNSLSEFDQNQVEIIILTDNKKITLGEKRNKMVDIAQGKYIAFVDDDDRISDDYIKSLLDATHSDADCVSFTAMVSLNGGDPKPCYYSKEFNRDYNTDEAYYRIPNHIPCIKREVSLKSSFPGIAYGEDSAYSKLLLPNLKTEFVIDKVLYFYDFNSDTTETQAHLSPNIRVRNQTPVVDIVFLSFAKDARMYRMTQNAINSCLAGANSLPVNIIVIEQNTEIENYRNATTHYIDCPFNYNQFSNIGARKGSAEWIMICNNDLVFHSGWLHQLLIAGYPLVSPKCPNDYRQKCITENEIGVKCGRNFSGWAFMIKRCLFDEIGGFDECFPFWFADNSTIEKCSELGVDPMLVVNSFVTHLGSETLNRANQEERDNLTWAHCDRFNNKYGRNLFHDNPAFKQWRLKQI